MANLIRSAREHRKTELGAQSGNLQIHQLVHVSTRLGKKLPLDASSPAREPCALWASRQMATELRNTRHSLQCAAEPRRCAVSVLIKLPKASLPRQNELAGIMVEKRAAVRNPASFVPRNCSPPCGPLRARAAQGSSNFILIRLRLQVASISS